MSKLFSDPLIIKVAELPSILKLASDLDHPLGLLKVKAENLRGILTVVRVKLERNDQIPPYQYPLCD